VIFVILYVFLDHIFGHFVANGAGKVAIFPEFSSPQFLFDFRIPLEDGSCRCPLHPLHNIGYRIFRWKSQEDMYMIFSNLHLFYLKIIAYCDLFDALLNKITKISSQYPFAVFWSPHYVVSCVVYGMGCSSYSHAYRLSYFITNLKDNVSSPLCIAGHSRFVFRKLPGRRAAGY